MERIILYYSDGGKTKVVAETLAINLRCDICQIKDMKKRDGIRNRFMLSNSQNFMTKLARIFHHGFGSRDGITQS